MAEPNYQKPPLREEIEDFFKQLKGVILFIVGFIVATVIVGWLHKFSKTDIAEQIVAYINNHFSTFLYTSMIALLSYAILYEALCRKHLIYKRYRLGYFSQMMWYFIGFFTLQLGNIPIALYMDDLIPIIIIELFALGITLWVLYYYKKEHPPLVRPLTKEENELRNNIISALLQNYQTGLGPTEHEADAFARASYLMDFHPELFDMMATPNIGFTIPSVFYSDILENPQNKLFVDIKEPRYKIYRERAYWQMTRDQDPESPFKLCKETFFE